MQNWQLLKRDILKAIAGADTTEMIKTGWGVRFRVRSRWRGLNGQYLRVITIWQQDDGDDAIRFVTLYPDKS